MEKSLGKALIETCYLYICYLRRLCDFYFRLTTILENLKSFSKTINNIKMKQTKAPKRVRLPWLKPTPPISKPPAAPPDASATWPRLSLGFVAMLRKTGNNMLEVETNKMWSWYFYFFKTSLEGSWMDLWLCMYSSKSNQTLTIINIYWKVPHMCLHLPRDATSSAFK